MLSRSSASSLSAMFESLENRQLMSAVPATPTLLKETVPGNAWSNLLPVGEFKGWAAFITYEPSTGDKRLWLTDGTADGTKSLFMAKPVGSDDTVVMYGVIAYDRVFFSAGNAPTSIFNPLTGQIEGRFGQMSSSNYGITNPSSLWVDDSGRLHGGGMIRDNGILYTDVVYDIAGLPVEGEGTATPHHPGGYQSNPTLTVGMQTLRLDRADGTVWSENERVTQLNLGDPSPSTLFRPSLIGYESGRLLYSRYTAELGAEVWSVELPGLDATAPQPFVTTPPVIAALQPINASSSIAFIVDRGLRINGTSGNDDISLRRHSSIVGRVVVAVNGQTFSFAGSDIDRIYVNAGAGNDRVGIMTGRGWVEQDMRVLGGDGDDTITTAAGDDTVFGGAGDDVIFTAAGRDWISGDAGNDRLNGGQGIDIVRGGVGLDRFLGAERREWRDLLSGDALDGLL